MTDAWEFSSGLVDDVDVTVTSSYFGYDSKYNNGETLLWILECSNDSDPGSDPIVQKYSCGSNWDTKDQGKTAISTKGATKGFNKNSAVAQLIMRCIELAGRDELAKHGNPLQASMLQDSRWHMDQVEFKQVGSDKTSSRLMPTKYLGFAAGKKATVKTKAKPKVKTPWEDLDEAVLEVLKDCVLRADSHDMFVEAVNDTFDDWSSIEEIVLDASDDGFYAKHSA